MDAHIRPSVYLTADIPAVGGRIKARVEDFLVEEIPLYEPAGAGEHLYLFVEKRNLSTTQMVSIIAHHYGVGREAVGFAGMKDKRAITRQLVSVHLPGRKREGLAPPLPPPEEHRLSVLWTDWHANKLRPGHLAGNRFIIRIRDVEATRVVHAHRVLERLEKAGVPNRAGEQRFGYMARNHEIGRALILGENRAALDLVLGPGDLAPEWQAEARRLYSEGKYAEARDLYPRTARTERRALSALARGEGPGRAVSEMDPLQRRYFITAFQSAVFNAVLEERLAAGTLARLEEGDLAWKHDNGAVFAVTPQELEGERGEELRGRLERLEVSPSGPMWGADMTRAGGAVGERELSALAATGVTPEMMEEYRRRTGDRMAAEGARKPLRVPLMYPDAEGGVDEHGHYIRCTFELPRGAFATVVMREVMKPELAGSPPEPEDEDD